MLEQTRKDALNLSDKLNLMTGWAMYENINPAKQKSNNQNCALFLEEGGNMKGITKRADGRYMIRKMKNGKRITVYSTSFTDAKKINTALKNNKIKFEQTNNILLRDWLIEWRDKYKEPFVAESTIKTINTVVNTISQNFADLKLKELRTSQIQDFLNNIDKGKTKDNLTLYFNAMLKKAVDLNYITKNPFDAVVRDKKTKYKQISYNFHEQQKIVTAIRQTDIYAEIMCYLLIGARPGELPQQQDFDLNNNFVIIHGTKTELSDRIVDISKNYSVFLHNYFKTNDFKSKKYVMQQFKQLCLRLEIKDANLYRLRHTFATNHFVLGTSAKQVQEWLGHADIGMTLNTYTNIDRTLSGEKIKKLYNDMYYLTPNLTPNLN